MHECGNVEEALGLFGIAFIRLSESIESAPLLEVIRHHLSRNPTIKATLKEIESNCTYDGITHGGATVGGTQCHCSEKRRRRSSRRCSLSNGLEGPSFVVSQPILYATDPRKIPGQYWRCEDPQAAVVFNCGMALHLWGLRHRSRVDLEVAITLYGLVERMLPNPTLFHLGLWNNIGQIYHALGNEEGTRHYFLTVSQFMLRLQSWTVLDPRCCDGFFLNVMALKGPEVAPAA